MTPLGATLVAPVDRLNFLHVGKVELPAALSPIQAWQAIMAQPLPGLALAFRIRDAISARFGVARIGGFSGAAVSDPKVGDKLDFFLVEDSAPDRLTLTARDRHLDVMICVTTAGRQLAVTASVITHNLFGRAYMIPVAPAHRWIVAAMLRRLARG
jgi:Protein of unknown function (DUF2867)